MKRIAAIVIGSNSTRMLIADANSALSNRIRGRIESRLLLGMDESHSIPLNALNQICNAINTFYQQILSEKAELIGVYATSAVRDASNSNIMGKLIADITPCLLNIISGEEEARFSFIGATGFSSGMVIDIGGGSTEIAVSSTAGKVSGVSMQLGAARLFSTNPINTTSDIPDATNFCLRTIASILPPSFKTSQKHETYLVGGTGTAVGRILRGGDSPDGVTITKSQLTSLLYSIAPMSITERSLIKGFPKGRENILPTGMIILDSLMSYLSIDSITVTQCSNCDGILLDYVYNNV